MAFSCPFNIGASSKNQSLGDSKCCKELGVWWQFRVQRLKSWTSAKFYPQKLTAIRRLRLAWKIPVWCEDSGTKNGKSWWIFSNEDLLRLILCKHITLYYSTSNSAVFWISFFQVPMFRFHLLRLRCYIRLYLPSRNSLEHLLYLLGCWKVKDVTLYPKNIGYPIKIYRWYSFKYLFIFTISPLFIWGRWTHFDEIFFFKKRLVQPPTT